MQEPGSRGRVSYKVVKGKNLDNELDEADYYLLRVLDESRKRTFPYTFFGRVSLFIGMSKLLR